MTSQKKIDANRRNAQKSTGPKTEAGKTRSAMNGIKHGKYVTRFWAIPAEDVGELAICNNCGEGQKTKCKEVSTCILQDSLLLAHIKTLRSKNLKHREYIDAAQIAQMDFIFSIRLREAINNLGQQIQYTTPAGAIVYKSAVSNEDIVTLMNFASHLQKNLRAMQLTRESQDISDVAWADLARADVNPEKALEAKQAILQGQQAWHDAQKSGDEQTELDEAIRQHRMHENLTEDENEPLKLGAIGSGPFKRANNG